MNNEVLIKFLLRTLIICIVILLFTIDNCNSWKKKSGQKISSDTITRIIRDTAWYPLAEKRNLKAADSVFIPVPIEVDTQAILQCFFAKYIYLDTLADTNMVIAIRDTVSQNRIISRKYTYQIRRPQTIQQITKQPDKMSLYAGASASINKNFLIGFSPEILITDKKKNAYGIGYDLLNKNVSARIYWKLNK